jgi:predicted CXXCH cytochrome family protein
MTYRNHRIYTTCVMIFLAAMVLLSGCSANTRYQALSFFFDGVPAPEGAAIRGRDPGAKASAAATEQPSRHGPFDARMCDACHQAGTNKLLLPKDELCLKCHTFKPEKRQHGPVVSGGCLVCHDPHRSANQYLLVSKAKEFCAFCHDLGEIYSHDVHRGSDLACTECHNPHGSDNDFLLR